MKVDKTTLALRLTLSFSLLGIICGQNIADSQPGGIVSFRPKKIWTEWIESPTAITNRFIATKEMTVCLRYTTFMNKSPMVLVENAQIKIMFDKSNGYLILRAWNATTSNDEYRRLLKPCKPFEPGHWLSLCIKVKIQAKIQEITYFQDGKKCFQTRFADGNFEWLYFQKGKKYFEDLLR